MANKTFPYHIKTTQVSSYYCATALKVSFHNQMILLLFKHSCFECLYFPSKWWWCVGDAHAQIIGKIFHQHIPFQPHSMRLLLYAMCLQLTNWYRDHKVFSIALFPWNCNVVGIIWICTILMSIRMMGSESSSNVNRWHSHNYLNRL